MAPGCNTSCAFVLLVLIASEMCLMVKPFLFSGRLAGLNNQRVADTVESRFCCRHKNIDSTKLAIISDENNESGSVSSESASSFYQGMLRRFQGDFDNYKQVVEDRRRGLLPAEGGGHEHIHCTLVPCPKMFQNEVSANQEQWVIAAFYLNGNPKQIFRFRLYRIIPPNVGEDNNTVRLKLHTLNPELDQLLRGCSEQPWAWWDEVYNLWLISGRPDTNERGQLQPEQWQKFQFEGIHEMASLLNGCDVLWSPEWNPLNHTYLYMNEYDDLDAPSFATQPEAGYHATMEAGPDGIIVDSISMIPGKRILIKDELSLWENEFWINDRGYDPDAAIDENPVGAHDWKDSRGMPYVYGNRRGVPYKLERVSSMKSEIGKLIDASCCNDEAGSSLTLERIVVNPELKWTLGDRYRTSEVYQQKLDELEAVRNT